MAFPQPPSVPDTSEDRWFDLSGLAGYSGMSISTLRRHLVDPEHPLPHHRVRPTGKDRGRVLVFKREFDEWVRSFAERHAQPARCDVDDVSWIRRGFGG